MSCHLDSFVGMTAGSLRSRSHGAAPRAWVHLVRTADGLHSAGRSRDSRARRWILVAASGRAAAQAYARDHDIDPCAVLAKDDLTTRPRKLREVVNRAAADGVIVHSKSWSRQRNPQLYELALSIIPIRERYIVDEERRLVFRIGKFGLAARIARIPAQALHDAVVIASETARLADRRGCHNHPQSIAAVSGISVLAVWPGSSESFGGSLTHITGILRGLRGCGFRVGLLTCFPPPGRLRAVVDEVEVIPPLPAASRITRDIEQISENAPLRRAGMRLAQRLQPAFVYQRHSAFLVAGVDLAHSFQIPLVLEWNGSEVWARKNWQVQLSVERIFDPLLLAMERKAASCATLVSSVSDEAAEMAFRAGAQRTKTIVVPNAVDLGDIDASGKNSSYERNRPSLLLGWTGSFGPWHGADVAVRALAALPTNVNLLMVGDGAERAGCEKLAASLKVAHRVEITGILEHKVALQRLAQCDVLLSPHTPLRNQPFFGSPTKIFEYMALGKPIVASRLGQLEKMLEDGVTACLVTPGDADELATAVKQILASPDRGGALGEAARREVARHHTWDQRAHLILERLGYESHLNPQAEPAVEK
jgi:glycosyltransferase involved in cell wall biosynthesis